MEEGRISPQLLHSESLWQKLTARATADELKRWAAVRNTAPAVDTEMLDKLNHLVALAKSTGTDHAAGATVFQKNCSVCHKIGDKGNLVGPQLDGIGSRGAQRIAEDVLLPNRNVDQAFRVSVLALADGRVLTGLKRREEGTKLIFANDKGEEFTVDQQELDELQPSNLSLMPDGFAKTLTPNELASLIAYLAAQK
jgi:putative heme-binding domain-containing protein